MKYLHKAIIYNSLGLIQIFAYIFGWLLVIFTLTDSLAKVVWITISTYFVYNADHPFFMSFKEPPELLSIEVSVGKEPLE